MYRCCVSLSIWLALVVFPFGARAATLPYIVADMDTGMVLAEHEPDHRWYPASLTKLMTAYVTFRAIKAGEISAGSPVLISKAATRQPRSRMGYKAGVRLRIDTALKIIVIKSANDVSLALAEAVAGTLEAFVTRMNLEAVRLGMLNTRFANSNGLHDTGQFSSARDMAILASRIYREFPEQAYLFAATGIKTPARTHYSYNLLLERFPGTNGMKTGFVCASGYNLVATANLDGRNLVAVVLGRESQTDRAVSAARLLDENRARRSGVSLVKSGVGGKAPRNMRPVLCTEKARAARYDPGAGAAVIKSPYLQPRVDLGRVLTVGVGQVDAPPSDAWISANLSVSGKVPVPIPRPDYDPATGKIRLAAIGQSATGTLPIPTPRPR